VANCVFPQIIATLGLDRLDAAANIRELTEKNERQAASIKRQAGTITPKRQWGDKPLKTDGSGVQIPIPRELTLMLSASVQRYGTDRMVTNGHGKPFPPWGIERAMRKALDGGTIWRRCSSRAAATSRPCKPGCGTHLRAPLSTSTGACGPTPTSPPGRRSVR
jgi:hypothetical protein